LTKTFCEQREKMDLVLRFLTKNIYKFEEFEKLFNGTNYTIIQSSIAIKEIQTEDIEALVADKVIKAFDKVRRPVVVDHTGLHLELLGGFPGGLTEIFWERLKNERLAQLFGNSENPTVTAVTLIGYCDGKSVRTFRGEMKGMIAKVPRGPEGFQWDPVFIPDGHSETFAEMGDKKNEISMRRLAINQLIAYLDKHNDELDQRYKD
jgi:XTP/dITP diphosphohydrolase